MLLKEINKYVVILVITITMYAKVCSMLQQLRPLSPKGLQPDGGVPDSSLSEDSVPPLPPPLQLSVSFNVHEGDEQVCCHTSHYHFYICLSV